MIIQIAKYHSYGNDFLILESHQIDPEERSLFSRHVCHPHFGIGADGVGLVDAQKPNRVSLCLFNRDGSEASMSGNGSRCAVAFAHDHGFLDEPAVTVETKSGLKEFRLLEGRRPLWRYISQMGEPGFAVSAMSVDAKEGTDEIKDYPLEAADRQIAVTALWMGNQQCVVFVDELPEESEVRLLGRALETHSIFPDRANVSFVRIEGPNQIRIKIWERGVGHTLSSGTGSCGAAVAAISEGKVASPVTVNTEGGAQEVAWKEGNPVVLTGETEFIGDIDLWW